MRNRKVSFKIKVLIPIMTIFCISVLIISAINYRLLDMSVKTKTNANLDIFTESILAQIKHFGIILDTTKQTLNDTHITIAKSVADRLDNSPDEITPEVLQRIAEQLGIIEFSVADSNGIIIGSNVEEYIGFDYKSTETTKIYMALADGTLTELGEEPRFSVLEGDERRDINHYTGVSRMGGGFIQLGFDAGVIGRLQDKINIEITIKETTPCKNGYGIVLSDGFITAHPNEELMGADVSGESWYAAISSGNGFRWVEIDNAKYYAGYKNKDGYTVVGLVPEKDFYSELNQVLNQTILFLSIAIIIMIAVVYLFLGRLLMPIKRLSTGLGEIAKGNLDARIGGRYNDEFDEIKNAVNSMAAGIKTYMNDKLRAERMAHVSELAKGRAEAAREAVISSLEYASKIQKNLLPPESAFREAFSDYFSIWKPKDIVGGDIYWIKNFEHGTVLCVCDCTGHGTPGALLTMLVVSTFEAVVTDSNYKDTADIIWELEKRLVSVLNVETPVGGERGLNINDGCDLAVLYVAKDGSVTVSTGHTNVYICDGKEVSQIKGQKIYVGEGKIKSKNVIETVIIPANPDNKFYISSDGLFGQMGDSGHMFGYKIFKQIILENHSEKLSVVSDKIWEAFESHRGGQTRRDDVELIMFKP